MQSIEIRAIQPDNESAIANLMRLFPRAYGNRFPHPSVYDMRFWKSHIGTKMASVGLYAGKDVVGHVALIRDKLDRGLMHIAYPVCEPEMLSAILDSRDAIDRVLTSQAERQGWRSLSFAVFGDVADLQSIAGAVFQMRATLLLPNYYPLVDLRPSSSRRYRASLRSGRRLSELRAPLLVTRRQIVSGTRSSEMYAPPRHADMIAEIFEGIGIAPEFASRQGGMSALPADARAIERYRFSNSGVSHSFVQPSLVSGQDFSALDSSGPRQRSSYVYVDLGDPACPYMSETLEELGFSFAGVMPAYRAKDYVVYFRTSEPLVLDEMFGNAGGKRIASYVESAGPGRDPLHGSDAIHQALHRQ